MQQFTPLQYLYIDIANNYGLDKENWDVRINWTKNNIDNLEELSNKVEYKTRAQYNKAVLALRKTQKGETTGHIMYLDATASGIAILSLLSGDYVGAKATNLINTGNRENAYAHVANTVNKHLTPEDQKSPADLKQSTMTHFYNSRATPIQLLGEDTPAYNEFIRVLTEDFKNINNVQKLINSLWDSTTLAHSFTLPDGHTAYLPSIEPEDRRIKVNLLNSSFTYRAKTNVPSDRWLPLAANIVHAVDGYIVREVVRRLHKLNIEIVTVHDAFGCHPCDAQQLREIYVEVLSDIAKSNLLVDILEQISNKPIYFTKGINNLDKLVLESDYAIC